MPDYDVIVLGGGSAGSSAAAAVKAGARTWKLCACKRSGEIPGAAMLGPRADDLIQLVALLMEGRSTVDRIFELPWYHPTLSEVMLIIGRDAATQIEAAAAGDVAGLPAGRVGRPDRSD